MRIYNHDYGHVTKLNVSMVPPAHLQPVVEVDESSTLQVQLVHDAEVRRCVGNPSILREQCVILITDQERPDLRSAPCVLSGL